MLNKIVLKNIFVSLFKSHAIEAADEGANNKVVHNLENNGFEDPTAAISDDDKKKKKKKRNGLRSIIKDNPMQIYRDNFDDGSYSRGRLGLNLQKPHENRFIHNSHGPDLDDLLIECPVLDAIDKRCQSVDLLSGGGATNEFTDALLPACGVHQFCYLCVSQLVFNASLFDQFSNSIISIGYFANIL